MTISAMVSSSRRQWLVAAGLIALGVVPVLAGSVRIGQLAGGGPVTEENARFFDAPVPVIVHIVSAAVYALLGAFQFDLLQAIRLVVGTAMTAFIVLGVLAIRRRHSLGRRAIDAHRAWMVRAYALGLGAGTQVFTHLPWAVPAGPIDESGKAIAMLASWLINVAVAEWVIRRRRG